MAKILHLIPFGRYDSDGCVCRTHGPYECGSWWAIILHECICDSHKPSECRASKTWGRHICICIRGSGVLNKKCKSKDHEYECRASKTWGDQCICIRGSSVLNKKCKSKDHEYKPKVQQAATMSIPTEPVWWDSAYWSRIVLTKDYGLPTFFADEAAQIKAEGRVMGGYFPLVRELRKMFEYTPRWGDYMRWVKAKHPEGASLNPPVWDYIYRG